jgi:hypothetical protein
VECVLRFSLPLCACLLFGLAFTHAQAEQPNVPKYDVYAGFSDLHTPGLNGTNQIGVHVQAGMNVSAWTALGIDYSVQSGSGTLTPDLLRIPLRAQLAAEVPRGYQLQLPFKATTQSFSGGGQLVIRHFKNVTFSVRPVLAAFHIDAVPKPSDPVATLISAQLAPTGHLTDWVGTYGAGGAAEVKALKWLGVRAQFDAGWNHPLSNLLDHGSVSYRYSIGPAFHFGPTLQPRI